MVFAVSEQAAAARVKERPTCARLEPPIDMTSASFDESPCYRNAHTSVGSWRCRFARMGVASGKFVFSYEQGARLLMVKITSEEHVNCGCLLRLIVTELLFAMTVCKNLLCAHACSIFGLRCRAFLRLAPLLGTRHAVVDFSAWLKLSAVPNERANKSRLNW